MVTSSSGSFLLRFSRCWREFADPLFVGTDGGSIELIGVGVLSTNVTCFFAKTPCVAGVGAGVVAGLGNVRRSNAQAGLIAGFDW